MSSILRIEAILFDHYSNASFHKFQSDLISIAKTHHQFYDTIFTWNCNNEMEKMNIEISLHTILHFKLNPLIFINQSFDSRINCHWKSIGIEWWTHKTKAFLFHSGNTSCSAYLDFDPKCTQILTTIPSFTLWIFILLTDSSCISQIKLLSPQSTHNLISFHYLLSSYTTHSSASFSKFHWNPFISPLIHRRISDSKIQTDSIPIHCSRFVGMSIQVFDTIKIVTVSRNSITSVSASSRNVYVSCKDGSLMVYEYNNSNEPILQW